MKLIGKKIYSYNILDSTNDTAWDFALNGEKEGSVIEALYQRKGRGRFKRKWVSPKNKGAYFSTVLRPDIKQDKLSLITIFSSLSIMKAIRSEVGPKAYIKWPNDVLVNEKKISGILLEAHTRLDKVYFVIVGIGINVASEENELPYNSTSIYEETGKLISKDIFMQKCLKYLDKYYNLFTKGEFLAIIDEYKEYCMTLGKLIDIKSHGKTISGYASDIDEDGALILRLDSGIQKRITAGDVC